MLPRLDDAPPAPAAEVPEAVELRSLISLQLLPPTTPLGFRWEAETTGLLLMLLELGLADLNDLVPRVGALPPAVGLGRAPATADAWTAQLSLSGEAPALSAKLTLCSGPENCRAVLAPVSTEAPAVGAAALIAAVAEAMNRAPRAGADGAWADRLSADPYAQLITGRGAATVYGLLPAPSQLGDERADPVMRAVLIDPTNPTAEWMRARRLLQLGDPAGALEAVTRARSGRAEAVALRAAEAELHAVLGRHAQALEGYQELERGLGPSARFVIPLSEAALAAGQAELAAARLDALPPAVLGEPAVAELRVRVADATPGDDARYDALLVRWAEAAPTEAEPLRRRVALRVRRGDLLGALELVPAYAPRGAEVEGQRLALALHAALGQLSEAAAVATALGEGALAGRLAARAALEADPKADLSALAADPDPGARLVAGWAALDRGDRAAAGQLLAGLRRERPHDPEVLALAAALSGAAADRAAVFWADPAFEGRLR